MTKQRSLDRFKNNLENLVDTKEDKVIYYGGILGTYDSLGNEIVDVPGRSNFSFVRLNGSLGEVIEAFNITVAAEFGLKVKVAKKPGEFFYEVIGLDLAQYSSWGDGGSNPFLPKHAFTHSFGDGTNVGNDPVFIYKRQLLQPLGMQPVGTGTAFYGYVNPDFYIWNNTINYFEGDFTANLSALKPTNSQSRYVTVYLDGNTGLLAYKTGSLFTPPSTVAGIIAEIPEVNILSEGLPLNAVYLISGTTSVNWDNMFDIRNFLNAGGQIGASTGSSSANLSGIPTGAVLFGSPSGTATWNEQELVFERNVSFGGNVPMLLIGTQTLPYTSISRMFITRTGIGPVIELASYASAIGQENEAGGRILGRAISGLKNAPSGTVGGSRLIALDGAGWTHIATGFKTRLAAYTPYTWNSNDTPAYMEMWATTTGTNIPTLTQRLFGNYEEHYNPVHLETLRFGTGSIYSQFIKSTGQAVMIPYVLPMTQGVPGSVLGNDGNGNLSWIIISVTGSGGEIMGGYPTGVPDNVIIFGKTGSISWDTEHFVYLDSTDQAIFGHSALLAPDSVARLTLYSTGQSRLSLINYGNGNGGELIGWNVGGTIAGVSGSLRNSPLVQIKAGGYDESNYQIGGRFAAFVEADWKNESIPTYWQLEAGNADNAILNILGRWYDDHQEIYKPLLLADYLQWGTGSVYTRISRNSSQGAAVAYILPTGQGGANTFLNNDGAGQLQWKQFSPGTTITGIADGAVLFGSPTGTILWDFDNFRWIDSSNQLLIGATGLAFSTNSRLYLAHTGTFAGITMVGYGADGGAMFGRAVAGSPAFPSGTQARKRLLNLEGSGNDMNDYTSFRARLAAISQYDWNTSDTPTYWEMWGNRTGTATPEVIARWYGDYQDIYKPVHLGTLRFGTGSIYTQFSGPTGSASIIAYKLPEAQGLANTYLRNDGSGNLSWATVTGASSNSIPGGYPTGIPDNVVLYGKTGSIGWQSDFVFQTGRLGIGTTTPLASLHLVLENTSFFRGWLSDQYTSDDDGSIMWFRKARGDFGAETAVQKDDALGELKWSGYNGASLSGTNAKIVVKANELFNSGGMGTRIEFYATITGNQNTTLVETLYGSRIENYKPVHLADYFRLGTGSVYSEFRNSSSQATALPYILPTGQAAFPTNLKNDGAGNLQWEEQTASITFIIDGGGSAITTGTKGDLEIPFGCVIQRWTMLGDQTGTLVLDIWKDTYANYPPTSADSITASAPPKIATGVKGQDSTLAGWTTTVTAGDTFRYQVNNSNAITRATISLKVRKT